MIGRVVSIKMNNTAVVLVTSTKKHPLYQKTYTRSKKFLADDQINTKPGDIVEIITTKPISKRKYWKVVKIVGRDIAEIVEAELKESAAEEIAEVMPEAGEDVIPSEVEESLANASSETSGILKAEILRDAQDDNTEKPKVKRTKKEKKNGTA